MVSNDFRIIADDLGLAVPVNDGILYLLKNQKLHGVSILPTGSAFGDAVNKLKSMPDVEVGVHLTLVEEASILPPKDIKSLLGRGGRLHSNHKAFFLRYIFGLIKGDEVEAELRAQITNCFTSGIRIKFLNSHQHLHLLPGIMDIVIKLAKEYDIPYIRTVCEPISDRNGGIIRKVQARFLHILSRLAIKKLNRAGLSYNEKFVGFLHAGDIAQEDIDTAIKFRAEMNCHPGYEDENLRRRYSGWGEYNWERELNLLAERG